MFNKFAAGRKVYGQGATSPTRGAVDPRGYIKRELARKSNQQGVSRVGADGQSDTRSGLAHKAIHGNIGNNVGRPRAGGMQQPGQQMSQWQVPSMGQGANGAPVGSPGAAPVAPAPAPVQVNNNGVLELPYNSEYYNQAMDAQQAFDAEMMNLGFEEQEQQQEMARFMRELESGYTDRQRETLGSSAGNGMLYSSQYSTGANRDATQYNNAKNDATVQNTNFMTNMAARKNAAQNALNQLLQRATQGYADSLAGIAGELGYGAEGAPTPTGAPVRPVRNGLKGGSGWGSLGGRPTASSIKPPKPPKGSGGTVAQPTPPKKKGKK